MSTTTIQYDSIDSLIEHAQIHWDFTLNKPPSEVLDELCLRPHWSLQIFDYLKNNQHEHKRMEIAICLFSECLDQVRYRMDRNDPSGRELLEAIKQEGDPIVDGLRPEYRMAINQAIFETKVPLKFSKLPTSESIKKPLQPDIQPQLPELLENLRKEGGFKTAFELNELLLPHIQQLPTQEQLAIIVELALSKKSTAHENAILMLLHPETEVRTQVVNLLDQLTDKKLFTPFDLRRLIVIRNWVAEEEREPIDQLILKLKKNKLQPAPFLPTKPSRITATIVDGAGAGMIMFETKKLKQRVVGGILFKIGVGIKDAWSINKAPKHCFDGLLEQYESTGTEYKNVPISYLHAIVQHFLYEAVSSKQVPSAMLLELTEAIGTDKWRPNPLDWPATVQSLTEMVPYTSDQLIQQALDSASWSWDVTLSDYWFESGPIVEQAVIEAKERHEIDTSQSLETITTQCLMDQCLEKWKLILLITALWMKSEKRNETFIELVCVLEALKNNIKPENIPVIMNISSKSVASLIQRQRATG